MPEFEVAWHEPGRGRRTGRLTAADASRVAPALGIAPERLLSVRMLPPRQGGAGAGRGALSLRLFAQELAVLLDAGIPLLEAVATLEQKEQRAAAARSLAALHAALAEGSSLSAALAAQPRVFDEMYVAVVRANERSGSLAAALRAHAVRRWHERGFYRLLARMLFRAAAPDQRWRVLQRFYGLDAGLVARFFAGHSSPTDKLRLVAGRPPVPLGRALAVLWR
jgi:hypothetical protein